MPVCGAEWGDGEIVMRKPDSGSQSPTDPIVLTKRQKIILGDMKQGEIILSFTGQKPRCLLSGGNEVVSLREFVVLYINGLLTETTSGRRADGICHRISSLGMDLMTRDAWPFACVQLSGKEGE